MTTLEMQYTFNAGEWAPSLNARVDLVKYKNAAALLENWFVDYRGGATTRPGTQYVLQTKASTATRLLPFQASFSVSYILEFGDLYVRFYANGAPVLEAALAVTAATSANPGVFTHNTHGFSNGDWLLASAFTGGTWGTNLNGNYYIVAAAATNTFQLTDLNGVAVSTAGFGTFSAGNVARVYTVTSPYSAAEVGALKYAQNVNTLILTHPNHVPYQLIFTSNASWALSAISFGATIAAPTGQSVATTLSAGSVNYAYVVTAVDVNGQESSPSAFATLASKTDIRSVAGTNTITWNAVTGAVSYNIYEAQPSYAGAVPAGSQFGFIGTTTSTTMIDTNIGPDYAQTPPVSQNPFNGSGVASITITNPGSYTPNPGAIANPTVSFSGGGGSGVAASIVMGCTSLSLITGGGSYDPGEQYSVGDQGIVIQVVTRGAFPPGAITSWIIVNPGTINGSMHANFLTTAPISGGANGTGAQFTATYGVISIGLTAPGTGYATPPTPAFSSGTAAATTTLGAPSAGNPTVPGIFQQRLVMAGPVSSPQQFNMSKPGAYYNFDTSQIIQADDAIQGTLATSQLQTIQAMIPMPSGLIMFTDKQAWLINGGVGAGSPISAIQLAANSQAYNGASGPQPIVATQDILFVQSKGSIVRDMVYNIYTNNYTGTDISAISSHLFYGFTIPQWAWAEEPYKLVWALRSDGVMLSLTFLKEQDFVAWTHHTTLGLYTSVASVVETAASGIGFADAIYFITQRVINGNTVQYIERQRGLPSPATLANSWQVDAGIAYTGAATLTFRGAQHLAGATVTGIAVDDTNVVWAITSDTSVAHRIAPFAMPTNGTFTLTAPTSPATGYVSVVVGLGFTPKFKTLPVDTGSPTIQARLKAIPYATIRVKDTLGLSIGPDFDHLVPMKDLVVGNVSSMLVGQASQLVSDLVTADARTYLAPAYTVPGQYCIQQSNPFPATILGVIPAITDPGDPDRRG